MSGEHDCKITSEPQGYWITCSCTIRRWWAGYRGQAEEIRAEHLARAAEGEAK